MEETFNRAPTFHSPNNFFLKKSIVIIWQKIMFVQKKIAQQHQHKDILSYNFFNLLIIMCYFLCSFYSHITALIWLSTKVPKLGWTMIEIFFFQ